MYLPAAGQFHVIKEQGSHSSLNPPSTKSTEIVAFIFIIPYAWLKFHLPGLFLKTGMLLEMLSNLEVFFPLNWWLNFGQFDYALFLSS